MRILAKKATPSDQEKLQISKLRGMQKELQDNLSTTMIRIQEGEEVYKRFVKNEVKIPGISEEHAKQLATARKEQDDEEKKKKKKEDKDRGDRSWRMSSSRWGDRFSPYARTPGMARLDIDKTNSQCARCEAYGHWHRDGLCKPEDVARVSYMRAQKGRLGGYGAGFPGSRDVHEHARDSRRDQEDQMWPALNYQGK